ncbi:MAG TPA: hypothetical protein DCQ31_08430 [Bacteroidales bacterium]|nr:hypothetical protein [Bacteroidales bacterium]
MNTALRELEQTFYKLKTYCLLTESEVKRLPILFLEIERTQLSESEYFDFVKQFNKLTNLNYKGDAVSRQSFYEGTGIYTNTDRIRAIENALKDKWIKENPTFLNLKNFCKNETIEKYANYEFNSTDTDSNTAANTQSKDFTAFKP